MFFYEGKPETILFVRPQIKTKANWQKNKRQINMGLPVYNPSHLWHIFHTR
jgi:hypothetical protein